MQARAGAPDLGWGEGVQRVGFCFVGSIVVSQRSRRMAQSGPLHEIRVSMDTVWQHFCHFISMVHSVLARAAAYYRALLRSTVRCFLRPQMLRAGPRQCTDEPWGALG
eukprot:894146-Alexandrium_andersonii.AAC.1